MTRDHLELLTLYIPFCCSFFFILEGLRFLFVKSFYISGNVSGTSQEEVVVVMLNTLPSRYIFVPFPCSFVIFIAILSFSLICYVYAIQCFISLMLTFVSVNWVILTNGSIAGFHDWWRFRFRTTFWFNSRSGKFGSSLTSSLSILFATSFTTNFTASFASSFACSFTSLSFTSFLFASSTTLLAHLSCRIDAHLRLMWRHRVFGSIFCRDIIVLKSIEEFSVHLLDFG